MNIRRFVLGLAVILCLCSFGSVNVYAENENEYLIRINVAKNCITIYKKDNLNEYTIPVKAMICSAFTDNIEVETVYAIIGKEEWKRATDGTYSKYAANLDEVTAICSTPYNAQENDALITEKFNGIGEQYSSENIWLNNADAKWIYENCEAGTTVVLYSNADEAGPLGSPNSIKIPEDAEFANWDPTDGDTDNPWRNKSARIEGMKTIETREGTEADLLKGIKAYDTCGNDVTESLIVMGNYDFNKVGTYTITYYLMDAIGSQVSESVELKVREALENVKLETGSQNTDIKKEKTNGQKLKVIIILGLISLLGAFVIIRHTKKE